MSRPALKTQEPVNSTVLHRETIQYSGRQLHQASRILLSAKQEQLYRQVCSTKRQNLIRINPLTVDTQGMI